MPQHIIELPEKMASAQTTTAKKDEASTESKPEQQTSQQKPAAALEEDDEFEDFPVDGMFPIPRPLSLRPGATSHAPGRLRSQGNGHSIEAILHQ